MINTVYEKISRRKAITKEQRKALKAVYDRGAQWYGKDYPPTYRAFRRTARHDFYNDVLIVPIAGAGFVLGIERDGYTHS